MSDTPPPTDSPAESASNPIPDGGRGFLVVLDDSEELRAALRFACRRAAKTNGRVALLYVTKPTEFEHWAAVGNLMREEAREEAEQLLQRYSAEVHEISGEMPTLYLRGGSRRDQLLSLIDEEPSISVLVLAASGGRKGPGPLISFLTGRGAGQLHVPMTIVPGGLSDKQIDGLT